MTWFAAHSILYLRPKPDAFTNRVPETLTVWENVYLIEATSPDEALNKAEARARMDEDSPSDVRARRANAEWVFAGIRKLIEVFHLEGGSDLSSGDELTFSQFLVPDLGSVERLAGKEVRVLYADPTRDDE